MSGFASHGCQSVLSPRSVSGFASHGCQSVLSPRSVSGFASHGCQSVLNLRSVLGFASHGCQSVLSLRSVLGSASYGCQSVFSLISQATPLNQARKGIEGCGLRDYDCTCTFCVGLCQLRLSVCAESLSAIAVSVCESNF